jgi:hypothetical protein
VWGLAAGAALGNPLNAIEAMGFGGIVLSGDRCNDSFLARQLGVKKRTTGGIHQCRVGCESPIKSRQIKVFADDQGSGVI